MANRIEETLEKMAERLAAIDARSKAPRLVTKPGYSAVSKAFHSSQSATDYDQREWEAKRAGAPRDPAEVFTASDGDEMGFLKARQEYEDGIRQPTPRWDAGERRGFARWCKAAAWNDREGMRTFSKANAPYTETTSAGGYLVPVEYKGELIRLMYLKSVALQKCRIVPMNSLTMHLPSVSAGSTAVWATINTATGDTKVTFADIELVAKKLVGISYVPNELMQDSIVSVGGLLADEFTESFAKAIDSNVFDKGDTDSGTALYAAFNSWAHDCTLHVDGDTGDSAAGSLTYANLCDAVAQLNDVRNIEWFFAPAMYAKVRSLVDDQNRPLLDLSGRWQQQLFGFDVNTVADMTAAPAASAATALLGNPRYMIIGDRMDLAIESSPHIAFTADQTVFRAVQRVAIKCALPAGLVSIRRGESA